MLERERAKVTPSCPYWNHIRSDIKLTPLLPLLSMRSPFEITTLERTWSQDISAACLFFLVLNCLLTLRPLQLPHRMFFCLYKPPAGNIQGCTVRTVSPQRIARWLNKDSLIQTLVLLSDSRATVPQHNFDELYFTEYAWET